MNAFRKPLAALTAAMLGIAAASWSAQASSGPAPSELFTRLSGLFRNVDPTIRKTLEAQEQRPEKQGFVLHTVGVGLMSSLTIGPLPIAQASIQPEIRLFYTRAEEPIFP